MSRVAVAALVAAALSGCASRGQPVDMVERLERSRHVDQRMLLPSARVGAVTAVETYQMQPSQSFRMPQAIVDPLPQLQAGSERTVLAPTVVCVRIVVSELGETQRVDALADREECRAGVEIGNADLMQAVRDGVLQWRFTPAAVCTWKDGAHHDADKDDCAGAKSVQPVPVSLLYAFTFEIREGKARVQQAGVSQPSR